MSANYILPVDSRCEAVRNPLKAGQGILVVGAECDLRQLTVEVLMDAGYQVDVAENGVAGWSALQLSDYDLLIMDQFMPKVSGGELLRKIHAARLTLPVIMATGFLPTWEFALHTWLQPAKMLLKPYSIDKLLNMVRCTLSTPPAPRDEVSLSLPAASLSA
jgi:DNA-binding response OmpR family regulator